MNSALLLAGKVVGTAALATGALVTAVGTHHSADASSTTKQVQCGPRLGQADPQLKAALKAARAKPAGQERRQALRAVRKDAAHGSYGDAAEIRALKMRLAHAHYRAVAPDALKSAIKAAAQKPAGQERKAAFQQIRKDAVAGTYGVKVEKIATKREARKNACGMKHRH